MKDFSNGKSWFRSHASRLTSRAVYLGLVPLLILICGVRSHGPEPISPSMGQHPAFKPERFRTVVVILDSVGISMALDSSLMPFVSSLASSSLHGRCQACPAKTTFPCLKSIFEGRSATTGTALQNFSAVASNRTTWPASLAKLGHRLVVASDHTLNRLYPNAFVDSLNYENLHVSLYERDGYAYRQTGKWLADSSIDTLIIHIIGTDKVSHEFEVRGPEYRAKYLEVDNFVQSVSDRLSPNDYLYVISDHGHSEKTGGHTYDAAYFARGPIFPPGRREDLSSEDMLFLLSVPFALTLPDEYEGQIRTDLTLLRPDLQEKLLKDQARLWRIKTDATTLETLQARLNAHTAYQREESARAEATEIAWRVGPWLLAGALFLLAEFSARVRQKHPGLFYLSALLIIAGLAIGLWGFPIGAWVACAGALIRTAEKLGFVALAFALLAIGVLGVLEYWIKPSGLRRFRGEAEVISYVGFFVISSLVGIAISFVRGVASTWREHAAYMLWIVALALWMVSYFGPYSFALTGHGPVIVICILVPLLIVLSNGVRTLFSWPGLLLLGVFPFVTFHTESYNISYPPMNRISELPLWVQIAACALLGFAFLYTLEATFPAGGDRNATKTRGIRALLLFLWIVAAATVFHFGYDKIIGVLLGALCLVGCIELFRRARIPWKWSALIGAILVFSVLVFVLNGFALSRVDFRFAANLIIPFQEEALRAPQLIAWAIIKYAFPLLPLLAVLRLSTHAPEIGTALVQFGWWRELVIVTCALGLMRFDPRGLHELCAEEIYFWTFLNLVFWASCLLMRPKAGQETATVVNDGREEVLPQSA